MRYDYMKKQFSSSFITIMILLGVVLFIIPSLSSCDNFMNNKETAQEIKDIIEYKNTPDCTVLFKSDVTKEGEFLSGNDKTVKLGYPFEVEFMLNTQDYSYNAGKLIIVHKTKPEQELNDYVEYEEIGTESDHKKGLYKFSITVIKKTNDILIRPDCLLIPKIKETSPKNSASGVEANTPIEITFNTPVTYDEGQKLVSITDNGIDLSDTCFETPVFDALKTTMTVKPKTQELIEYIESRERKNIDLKITVSDKLYSEQNNSKISVLADEKISFTIRVNSTSENTPPEYEAMVITKNEYSLEMALSQTSEISKFAVKTFENFTQNDAVANRVEESIYIYGRYFDTQSGVKSVIINEKQATKKNGNIVYYPPVYEPEVFTKNSPQAEFVNEENGYTSFRIKYDLKTQEEGSVLITVNVTDVCNNISLPQTFNIIKYTGIDIKNIVLYNHDYDLGNYAEFDFDYYNLNLSVIKIKTINLPICGTFVLPDEKLTVTYSYTLDGVNHPGTMTYDKTKGYWYSDLGLTNSQLEGLEILVTVTDDFNNESSKKYSFPGQPVIGVDEYGRKFYIGSFPYTTSTSISQMLTPGEFIIFGDNGYNTYDPAYTGDHYAVFANGGLYGPYSDNIEEVVTQTDDTLPIITIKDVDYFQTDTPGAYIKVSIPHTVKIETNDIDIWNVYDYVCMVYTEYEDGEYEEYDESQFYFFTRNTYDLNCLLAYDYFSEFYTLSIYGVKKTNTGTAISKPSELRLQDSLTDGTFITDNIAPKLNHYHDSYFSLYYSFDSYTSSIPFVAVDSAYNYKTGLYTDYMLLPSFYDHESGVYFHMVSVNGGPEVKYDSIFDKKYGAYDYEGNYFATNNPSIGIMISVWDLDVTNNFEIKGYDKAGNYSTTEYVKTFYDVPQIKGLTKISDSEYKLEWKPFENKEYDWYVCLYEYDEAQSKWEFVQERVYAQKPVYSNENGSFSTQIAASEIELGKFLKIISTVDWSEDNYVDNGKYGFSNPYYYYTGLKNSRTCDEIIPYGNSDTSFLIKSDAPVFVQTLVTAKSYDECKNWTIEQWQTRHRHFNEKFINFLKNERIEEYSINPADFESGEKCYVVVVNYADGTAKMTDVIQLP